MHCVTHITGADCAFAKCGPYIEKVIRSSSVDPADVVVFTKRARPGAAAALPGTRNYLAKCVEPCANTVPTCL